MPKPDDDESQRGYVPKKGANAERSEEEHKAILGTERKTFTAKAAGAKADSGAGAPKQNPGEDLGSYARRVREYRESEAQRKAMQEMKK